MHRLLLCDDDHDAPPFSVRPTFRTQIAIALIAVALSIGATAAHADNIYVVSGGVNLYYRCDTNYIDAWPALVSSDNGFAGFGCDAPVNIPWVASKSPPRNITDRQWNVWLEQVSYSHCSLTSLSGEFGTLTARFACSAP